MSAWADRFMNSKLWELLRNHGINIDAALERDEAADSTDAVDGLERLRAVLTLVGKCLDGADPELVQLTVVSQLETCVLDVDIQVQAFLANGDESHIRAANDATDKVLNAVSQINVSQTVSDVAGIKAAAFSYRDALKGASNRFRSSVEQQLLEFQQAAQLKVDELIAHSAKHEESATAFEAASRSTYQALEARLTELSGAVAAEKARTDAVVTEFQLQFSAAQENRAKEYSDARTARETQINEDREARRAALHDAVATQAAAFEALQAQFEKESGHLQTHFEDKSEVQLREFMTHASDAHKEIEKHKADVSKLVRVIGELGITHGYQKAAKAAWWAVLVWNVIAVGAMLALIAVAYEIFVPEVTGEFKWPAFAGRVAFTITVGVLAAYAGTQASKYLTIEKRNRKLALELAALAPFLEGLPAARQEEFRMLVGGRSFGQEETPAEGRSPATVLDLVQSKSFKDLKEFVDALQKLVHSEK